MSDTKILNPNQLVKLTLTVKDVQLIIDSLFKFNHVDSGETLKQVIGTFNHYVENNF